MKYELYQLKDDESLHYHRFVSLDRLKREGNSVDKSNYNMVYEDDFDEGMSLDDIYYKFNMAHPIDFKGHSLSVSDIIVIKTDDKDIPYYVDDFGFAKLNSF